MWTSRYRSVCVLIGLIISSALATIGAATDPSTLPLLQFADLTYIGAFRLPDQFVNGDGFTHGGTPITFNAARNSLFIASRAGKVAEVAIPTPVSSNDVTKLPFASFLQGFYEPTEGTLSQVATGGSASISGLLALDDRLYGTASIYYDANNTQRVSHYARSATLSTPGVTGMKQVWIDEHSGFVSGYMAAVPAEWQAKLGGPAVTGQCCLPVAWRTSWGPSAFVWNPLDMYSQAKVPATPLLYYPHEHPTLGHWEHSNPTFGGTTQITGVALVSGSRTALFFGRTGTGPFCYGNGTNDPSLVGTIGPDGASYCYDPTSTAKAQHAYPYNYQIWAYDLNELAAVKAGLKQPWDVKPYGVWPFSFPFLEPQVRLGGIGYDAGRQLIYVSQVYADQDGYGYRPIIHVLKVGGGAVGAPLPQPSTSTLPPLTNSTPSSPTITGLALSANKAAPQTAGTTITFSATPTGGIAPHEYKWLMHDGASWNALTGWSTASTMNWTPSSGNSQYRIGVWVRSAGKTADAPEATNSMDFAITGGTTTTAPAPTPTSGTSTRLTAVTLAANKPAPQPANTTITLTAAPNGGTAPQEYKWLLHNGASWQAMSGWTTSNTFNWTPSAANSQYRLGVWVRSAGNTVDAGEATTSIDYPITAATTSTTTTAPPPTTTSTTARLTAVTLTANMPAPQAAGTTITFAATPNGGAAPHQYKWLLHNGAGWQVISDWVTSNTFNWTPTAANSQYRFGVWVRSAGYTADAGEATMSIDYPISGSTTTTTTAPAPTTSTSTSTSTRLTAVTLSANKAAPQPQLTTITFTATPNGGATPQQYKWLLHDGVVWKTIAEWSTANTFNWTPAAWNSQYRIGVWARSAGVTADAPDATSSVDYPITAATTTSTTSTTTVATTPTTAVGLTANRIAPQAVGTSITFTATPVGGTAPHQYKFLIHNGASWNAVTAWSTTNTFTWTPTAANVNYRVGVWVRSAGVATDAPQASNSIDYPIR